MAKLATAGDTSTATARVDRRETVALKVRVLPLAFLICATVFLSGCATRPVKAPSTAKINESASKIGTRVAVAKITATGGKARIVSAEAELARIARENANISGELNHVLSDLKEAREAFDKVTLELSGAEVEIENLKMQSDALQKEIDRVSAKANADAVVADRCKSWFGLGAIFYGIEHLLKAGIVGVLILVAVVIALLCVGGPVSVFALNGLRAGWGMLRKKTT